MDLNIVRIISSCNTIHNIEKKSTNRFFLFRNRDLKYIKKAKKYIENSIKDLKYNDWTVEYIKNMQQSFILYWDLLNYDLINNGITILNYDSKKKLNISNFFKMEFQYSLSDNIEYIILDIIGQNIIFSILDESKENTLNIVSMGETQFYQKKYEKICKNLIENSLISYLYNQKELR